LQKKSLILAAFFISTPDHKHDSNILFLTQLNRKRKGTAAIIDVLLSRMIRKRQAAKQNPIHL